MKKNVFLLLCFLLIGAVIGGILGDIFGSMFPLLNYGRKVGFEPFTLDLLVIQLTLGFSLSLTLSGIIGLIISLAIFSRIK